MEAQPAVVEAPNRPKDTPFRQQRLPILTPFVVITVFLALGVIMFPLGFIMWHFNGQVREVEVRYDDACGTSPTCTVFLNVSDSIPGPAFFYYKLTNFYQNHRRYVSSRADGQLAGVQPTSLGGLSECTPLQSANNSASPPLFYYPCGLIANSFFTDSFALTAGGFNIPWSRSDISWASDRNEKFKNTNATGILPPWLAGKFATPFNVQNEDFIVWMRVAGLPTFRKLYARFPDGLRNGTYEVQIANNYPTTNFGNGTKSVLVTSTSFIGGKNPFLGYAYIAVGSLCLLLAIVFFVVNLVTPRRLGDPSLLSWNRMQGDSAVLN